MDNVIEANVSKYARMESAKHDQKILFSYENY